MRFKNAFSLVELLGVVAIIALLANVALISTRGSVAGSQEALIKRQVQSLNSAYQSYIASGGGAPASNDGSRPAMKADAVTMLRILMQPFDTRSYGIVGPFMPADSELWVSNEGGNEVIGKPVLSTTNYIGFNGVYGFSFLGPD